MSEIHIRMNWYGILCLHFGYGCGVYFMLGACYQDKLQYWPVHILVPQLHTEMCNHKRRLLVKNAENDNYMYSI